MNYLRAWGSTRYATAIEGVEKMVPRQRSSGKAAWVAIFTALFLVPWIVAATPALAARMDCSISGSTCGFGSTVEASITGEPLVGTGVVATLDETVFKLGAVRSYVFTVTNTIASTFSISEIRTSSISLPANINLFKPGVLNHGIVTDETSASVVLGANAPPPTFNFTSAF